mmetsp:Transcript_7891/g.21936  ORF Transcript_7891/g.21936 Transcript_7891/m.21936 type:complete len:286 (-) Transcript_7891:23-880(-)
MSARTSPPSSSSKGDGKISSHENDFLDGKFDGALKKQSVMISSQVRPNGHDDLYADDDEHDAYSKGVREKECTSDDDDDDGDDDYSYGDDEYSISDYIQGEIERQLTEEIDAALQREIDAQLDRAIEECERQLEDELEKNLYQSLQIGHGSTADGEDDKDGFDTCTDKHCSTSSSTCSSMTTSRMQRRDRAALIHDNAPNERDRPIIKATWNGPKNNTASTKGKEGEDDVDVTGILLLPRAKNEISSTGRSSDETNSSMKRTGPAASVVDVNKTIQSVIDSHKIR